MCYNGSNEESNTRLEVGFHLTLTSVDKQHRIQSQNFVFWTKRVTEMDQEDIWEEERHFLLEIY